MCNLYLQNALHNSTRFGLGVRLGSDLGQKFANCTCAFEILQRISQIAQIEKLHTIILVHETAYFNIALLAA